MTDPERLLANACQLRKSMTFPERKLWYALRNRNLAGVKFRRQVPVLDFIADYLCSEHSLIIELDGDSHIDQYDHDVKRQHRLEQAGYRVLRFGNGDVLHDFDCVLAAILLACGQSPR